LTKRYRQELAALPATYALARAWDPSELAKILARAGALPIEVVGSGGSFSVATYCAGLHQHYTGQLARAITPLTLLTNIPEQAHGLLCVSASGRNADIRAAFERGLQAELRPAIAFATVADNPLEHIATKYRYADAAVGPAPALSDGFLAVNSVLATCMAFARAYAAAAGRSDDFPDTFEAFVGDAMPATGLDQLVSALAALDPQLTISVLFSPDLEAGAVDLESRFVEAALGPLHIADYRNFGHGRHNWLAKRGSETAVLSLAAPRFHAIAESTLKLIPPDVRTVHVDIEGKYPQAGLMGLITSLYAALGRGQAQNIDPGKPGVPEFGRKLYHLAPPRSLRSDTTSAICARKELAIRRVGGSVDPAVVREASEANRAILANVELEAIALDYDGTICDARRRFIPLPLDMAEALTRVVELGLPLGIATGRGKSVGKELRSALPRNHWDRVAVGYYNGAEVALLSDEDAPHKRTPTDPTLQIVEVLRRSSAAFEWDVEARAAQVTLTPTRRANVSALAAHVQHLLNAARLSAHIVTSGHSLDILLPGVCKRNLLKSLADMFDADADCVLRIGDRGAAPGNDHDLLNHPLGLSVDEVSPDLESCWRRSPKGHLGPRATLDYLGAIGATQRGVTLGALPGDVRAE